MFNNRFDSRKRYENYGSKTSPRRCQYCARAVFYYENGYGSRVFFDDLGKPWLTHSCREFLNTVEACFYVCGSGEKKKIDWVRRGPKAWYRLDGVSSDIVSLRHRGVYIIWYFDGRGIARTVQVGSGRLGVCLEAERRNPGVQKYVDRNLHVTWALVSEAYRDKVSVSLRQKLEPFVGREYSSETEVCVGLPSTLKWY